MLRYAYNIRRKTVIKVENEEQNKQLKKKVAAPRPGVTTQEKAETVYRNKNQRNNNSISINQLNNQYYF